MRSTFRQETPDYWRSLRARPFEPGCPSAVLSHIPPGLAPCFRGRTIWTMTGTGTTTGKDDDACHRVRAVVPTTAFTGTAVREHWKAPAGVPRLQAATELRGASAQTRPARCLAISAQMGQPLRRSASQVPAQSPVVHKSAPVVPAESAQPGLFISRLLLPFAPGTPCGQRRLRLNEDPALSGAPR